MLYTNFLTERKIKLQSEIEELLNKMEMITEIVGNLKKKTDYYYILVHKHNELYEIVMSKISDLRKLNIELFAVKAVFGED